MTGWLPTVALRCATFNLLHGLNLANGRVELSAAADAIAALDVDLVALQEVDRSQPRSGRTDQVGELARRLGWHGVFGAALNGSPDRSWVTADPASGGETDGRPAYGVGLLSRWPLRRAVRIRLPGGGDGARKPGATPGRPGWDYEPRVALAATLTVDGIDVRVVSTHLSYLPWRGLAQLRAAAGAVDRGLPSVLLGDLNLAAWAVRLTLPGWRHVGGAATYPTWRPRLQLDHILVRGAIRVRGTAVAERSCSDHLPIVCHLQL